MSRTSKSPKGKAWSHFVGLDRSRLPDPADGVTLDGAFCLSCYAGPRTVPLMVLGDRIAHHRLDFTVRGGGGLSFGFVSPDVLSTRRPRRGAAASKCKEPKDTDDDEDDDSKDDDKPSSPVPRRQLPAWFTTPVTDLTPHACGLEQPLGAPWYTVEAEWTSPGAKGEDTRASFKVLASTETLTAYPDDSVLCVTVSEGSALVLSAPRAVPPTAVTSPAVAALRAVSHDGPLRFHPGFRPRDVEFNSITRSATCTEGPRSIVLWGLPPDRIHRFTLHLVGAMNVLGLVLPSRKLLLADVRRHSKFIAGGCGREEEYPPGCFTDLSGSLEVMYDPVLGVLRLRTERVRAPVVVTGFPPSSVFAITMYASSKVTLGERLDPSPAK